MTEAEGAQWSKRVDDAYMTARETGSDAALNAVERQVREIAEIPERLSLQRQIAYARKLLTVGREAAEPDEIVVD
jgi:hypothetical protein